MNIETLNTRLKEQDFPCKIEGGLLEIEYNSNDGCVRTYFIESDKEKWSLSLTVLEYVDGEDDEEQMNLGSHDNIEELIQAINAQEDEY